MFCHGNPAGDHCCWINGIECPNLLTGQALVDAVQAQIDLYNFKGPVKRLAQDIGEGVTFACHVAVKVIAAHVDATGQAPDRATFEDDWAAHADYQPVADAWEAIGKPRSWCPVYGPAEGQCCFAEDQATNDAAAAGIPVSIRGLRQAITGAD